MTKFSGMRAKLEARRAEILGRVGRIEGDLRAPHDADWVEQAAQLENDEVLEGLDDLGRAEIRQIDDALSRIENGAYGLCRACGEPIDDKRLEAVPTASRCINCAK